MTAKLQKELVERTRSRNSGDTIEAPPETQAEEQIEESAVNLVGGIGERTGGASKAVRRDKQTRHRETHF